MSEYKVPTLPLPYDLETKAVLRQLTKSHKKLAELKGIARTIPNENILVSTLSLQEAKDSSEVENIVTTHDELYRAALDEHTPTSAPAKEVLSYREAIQLGFKLVKENRLLTCNIVKQVQARLENNDAGFRSLPGTRLLRNDGEVVYTPPQEKTEIEVCMDNLEQFINESPANDMDPLVKMSIIHHQFESIHPFYDGNGRTGRIVNVLYLVVTGLLDLPILYLSRYITRNKSEYYKLIQNVRDSADKPKGWENWILFLLKGIEETASETIDLVQNISDMMSRYKQILRPIFGKQYKHELLNNLFFHPYTKIEYLERDLEINRKTAAKYLNAIAGVGLLEVQKLGKSNYYINRELVELFLNVGESSTQKREAAEFSP